jgi:hypothetical protein
VARLRRALRLDPVLRHRGRALAAIYGTAGLLALPWAIDYAVRRVRHTSWRPPAVPSIRISTGRLHP